MQNQIRETARTVVAYLRALYNFCSCPLPTSPPERSTVNLLRGLAPSPQLSRSCSPSRKRRTKDGIAVSFSTVTPDCQELDWHDTRTDTRPRDPPSVHPALQCLPSIAARRPAAQPRSAPLTVRDGQAGPARCPSCAWRPAPRPRPRSVCHVVVVGLVPLRLLFALPQCSWDRSQTHGFRDQIDAQTHGFRDQIDPQTHGLRDQIDPQTHENPWVWSRFSDRYQTHGFRVQRVEFGRQQG